VLISEHEKGSKLDPRVRRTRKLLLQALNELLAREDFHSITVHDIAERAEVNRATFYAHFPDKYALLAYGVREAIQDELEKRLPSVRTFTPTNFRLLAVTVSDFMSKFMRLCHPSAPGEGQVQLAMQVQQYTYELLEGWFVEMEGTRRLSLSQASHIAAALSWMIVGTTFQSVATNEKHSTEQVTDQMLAFLAPSLQAYAIDALKEITF
jgi:AcrR family transcriptional regulator